DELFRPLRVLLAGAARVPGGAIVRRGPTLRIDRVREWVASVERRGRPRLRRLEELLETGQAGDRRLRVQGPVPFAARELRDRAAVVEDEAERRVPVLAADIERCEPLDVLLHRPDLDELTLELREARRRLRKARLLEQVAPVRDHARARVVRDAVELAEVGPPGAHAGEPLRRVVELRGGQTRERAGR